MKMIGQLANFTYSAYVDLLKFLQSKYRVITFSEVHEVNCLYLILRHDIDASLDAALTMAKIENRLNIRSTYFVLFSHKLYNLRAKDDSNTLKEISKLGHEIGLHYDVEAYESYGRDLKETLKNEIELLQNLLNRKVFSIACHNPTTVTVEDPFKNITEYVNAYDPEFCRNYVSDSCRAWYLEDLSRLLNFNYKKVQLLIHPFLWTEDICKREAVLERLFRDIEDKNLDYKLKWLELWHKNPRVKDYDKLIEKHKRI